MYLIAPLHPSNCIHPVYKWGQGVDIRIDVEPLFKLSYQELKKEMQKEMNRDTGPTDLVVNSLTVIDSANGGYIKTISKDGKNNKKRN